VFVIVPKAQFIAQRVRFFPAYRFHSRVIAAWPEIAEGRPAQRWRFAVVPDPANAPSPPPPPLWELVELTNVPPPLTKIPKTSIRGPRVLNNFED
jgi:hypothetical protein